ncbi:MAG TPA: MFS transporter [Tepidisphaeraceae bacterium]|jgi:SHS family lactate transporter-like MFS transporter|nr:MFS transporter [Tepidisphaeraceae bacterium]
MTHRLDDQTGSIPLTSPGDGGRALLAGFLGWTLDAFDYFLVVICLTAIAKDFHTRVEYVAVSITITMAFRPVGAFLFGLLADRYGRRLPLMLDLVFYSIIEVLSGLAPNLTTFLILRALFGIGMGGEWGVGASLAMEKVPAKWRGVLSGVLQEGYAVGNLLASFCFFFIFPRVGWRPLFFLGGLPALLAIYVRFGVRESEVWQRTRHNDWSNLGRSILSHWPLFLYLVALMAMMNFSSHGTQDLYPTFLEKSHGFGPQRKALLNAFTMVGAVSGGIVFGLLSDRIGRRRAMIAALLLGCCVVPMWAFAKNTALLWTGGFLIQFMVQGAWGVIPAHISELSPDSVRGFLPGFAYQCGVLIAGTAPAIQSFMAERAGWSYANVMALTALIVFVLAAVVTAAGPEKHAKAFGVS